MNRANTSFPEWFYRGAIGFIVALILYETQYIANTMTGKIDMIDEGQVRLTERVNEIDKRLAVSEDRVARLEK